MYLHIANIICIQVAVQEKGMVIHMLAKIIASSILILTVFIIRAIFQKRINPLFLYPIWLIVALRLLLPGMVFFSPISIMNTRLWETGSRILEQEYERQDRLAKQEAYQKYYEQMATTLSDPSLAATNPAENAQADTNMSVAATVNAGTGAEANSTEQTAPSRENSHTGYASQSNASDQEANSYEIKLQLAATPFGKLIQLAQIAWIIGMLFFTLLFGWQNLSFYNYLRRTRQKWADYPVGQKTIPVYKAGDKLMSPCLVGFFPAIYVPQSADEATLPMALEHEAVHYLHRDHVWGFVRIICLITNWYNPLVWISAKLSIKDAELSCDTGCIRRLGEEHRNAYGEALIAMIRQTRAKESLFQYATMMTSGKKFMTKIIANIAQGNKNSRISLAVMTIALFFCAGCTYTGTAQMQLQEPSGSSRTASTSIDLDINANSDTNAQLDTNVNMDANTISGSGTEQVTPDANQKNETKIQEDTENRQHLANQKAIVLKDWQEGLNGYLEGVIFLLSPEPGQESSRMNVALIATDLCVPDLEGNDKSLDDICQNYEEDDILSIINKNMDLDISEIEVLGYNDLIQHIDEAGGILINVREEEIAHINNYQLMITGTGTLGENEVTKSGAQVLNGIQTAAYLQIRYSPSESAEDESRWKPIALSLLQKDGLEINGYYDRSLSAPDEDIYAYEGYSLLCLQWADEVSNIHNTLYPGNSYLPSDYVKELDMNMKKKASSSMPLS